MSSRTPIRDPQVLQDGEIPDQVRDDIFQVIAWSQSCIGITFSVAHRSPEEIIVHLRETCEGWFNGRSLDDDVTFVVMKMKVRTESG